MILLYKERGGGRVNASTPYWSLCVTGRVVPTDVLFGLVLVGPVLLRLAGAIGVPRQTGVVVVILGHMTLTGTHIDVALGALRLLGAAIGAAVYGRTTISAGSSAALSLLAQLILAVVAGISRSTLRVGLATSGHESHDTPLLRFE